MATEKVIIYDDSCPLCCWYTDAFVNAGLLKEDNRLSFSQLSNEEILAQLDLERSKDEIPLLDRTGGSTLYGIDSLLEILGHRWPWVRTIAHITPVNWCLRRLYKLVSYNRRVIAATITTEDKFDCKPHFNLFYRLIYILFAVTFGIGTLLAYCWLYFPPITWYLVGIFIAALLIGKLNIPIKKRINYWGIMLSPILLAGLILLPTLWYPALKYFMGLPAFFIMTIMLKRRWNHFANGTFDEAI